MAPMTWLLKHSMCFLLVVLAVVLVGWLVGPGELLGSTRAPADLWGTQQENHEVSRSTNGVNHTACRPDGFRPWRRRGSRLCGRRGAPAPGG
nr:MAG TPA: hypothetical protein [Caudoviricetes sp.]